MLSALQPYKSIDPTTGEFKDPRPHCSESTSKGDSRELLLSLAKSSNMAPEVHHLFHHPVADHSFSADRQTLAVARDINVELYRRSDAGKFTLQDELKGHDKTVTSVDIAPSSGRIVTCSQGESSAMGRDVVTGLAS